MEEEGFVDTTKTLVSATGSELLMMPPCFPFTCVPAARLPAWPPDFAQFSATISLVQRYQLQCGRLDCGPWQAFRPPLGASRRD